MPRGTRWRENKVVPGRVAAISAKDTDRNPRVTPRPAQGPAHATVNLLAPSVHCSLLSVARPSSTFHPLAFLSSFHPPLFTFPTFPSLAPLLSFFFLSFYSRFPTENSLLGFETKRRRERERRVACASSQAPNTPTEMQTRHLEGRRIRRAESFAWTLSLSFSFFSPKTEREGENSFLWRRKRVE